jgi:hypothetical protein
VDHRQIVPMIPEGCPKKNGSASDDEDEDCHLPEAFEAGAPELSDLRRLLLRR